MDEISELVAAYNEAEQAQKTRLERIYLLVGQRKGARFVRFGDNGRLWMNSWDAADRALNGLVSFISEVNKGGE